MPYVVLLLLSQALDSFKVSAVRLAKSERLDCVAVMASLVKAVPADPRDQQVARVLRDPPANVVR